MDFSTAKWLSELEMDDPALNYQWQMMNSIDDHPSVNDDISFAPLSSDHESCSTQQSSGTQEKLPHEASQSTTSILKPSFQPANKVPRFSSFGLQTSQKPSSSLPPRIISFGTGNIENSNFPARNGKQHNNEKPKYPHVKTESDEMVMPFSASSINSFGEKYGTALEYGFEPFYKKGFSRTPSQAQDHVLAERKRREKLSQQLISLSAIVPGLKKLDKASVIGGAIKHIKQLEEKIKFLEDEKKKKKPAGEESAVSGKRPRTSVRNNYEDASSSVENISGDQSSCDQQSSSAAEIEVRTLGGDVLIRVHCKEHKGIMVGFFSELEKIHLSITSSSFMPFGDGMLLVNAVGQMDEEFSMTAQDLANHIRQAMLKLF